MEHDNEVLFHTVIDPGWIETVCEEDTLFSTGYCGYWLRAIEWEATLGWLVWEDDEQHTYGQEPNVEEAIIAWKTEQLLPKGYWRLDVYFARRSWVEGVRLAGEGWYEEGDSDLYDQVVQQTLFGQQVYA